MLSSHLEEGVGWNDIAFAQRGAQHAPGRLYIVAGFIHGLTVLLQLSGAT